MEEKLKFELTEEQAKFLKEYVSSMSAECSYYDGHSDNRLFENYKKDFILTEEMEEMVEELHQLFYNFIVDMHYIAYQEILLNNDVYAIDVGYRLVGDSVTENDKKFFAELIYDCNMSFDEEEYEDE